ncbi:hypothetical protein SBOR_7483 [Sclerotinia borealis F-4128]|uniref:Uncharacterized protein n=1 Tax=Sclerotinia borealis (strain F-4128) TaxID=1432307 RepID=W9C8F0_SCLBF|nr:hypothetical protein SBOR_7483 [Sclerotinia borealis F-4128]
MADVQQASPFDESDRLRVLQKKLGEQTPFSLVEINNAAEIVHELVRSQGLAFHFLQRKEPYSLRSTWNPKLKKSTSNPDWAEALRIFRETLNRLWQRGSYEMEHHKWMLRNRIIELGDSCQEFAYQLVEKDREIEKQKELQKLQTRAEVDLQDQIQSSIIKKEQMQTKLTASKDSRKILQEKLEGTNIRSFLDELIHQYEYLENIIKKQLNLKICDLVAQPVAPGVADNREEKHQLVTFGDTNNAIDLKSDGDDDIRNLGSAKTSERSKPQYNSHAYPLDSNNITKKVLGGRVTKNRVNRQRIGNDRATKYKDVAGMPPVELRSA